MFKMLDVEKLARLKWLGIVAGVCLLLAVGYGFGAAFSSKPAPKTVQKTTKKVKKQAGSELSQTYVKDFLIAYFTKKDLGENRNRYLPFMTEGAYRQEVNKEEDPGIKAYQGYVVDSKLKNVISYIDEENKTVLVKVTYTNTLLQKKNNYEKAQTGVSNQSTLRLTYAKVDGRYLVSRIEPILIVDTLNAQQEAALQKQNQTSTEEITEKGEQATND